MPLKHFCINVCLELSMSTLVKGRNARWIRAGILFEPKDMRRGGGGTVVWVYADFSGVSKIFFSRFWVISILPVLKQ